MNQFSWSFRDKSRVWLPMGGCPHRGNTAGRLRLVLVLVLVIQTDIWYICPCVECASNESCPMSIIYPEHMGFLCVEGNGDDDRIDYYFLLNRAISWFGQVRSKLG
jgi:hypothetical protein